MKKIWSLYMVRSTRDPKWMFHTWQHPKADLGGHSVGDVGLHCRDVLLRVIHRDKQVPRFVGVVVVPRVWLNVVVQLQPIEQRGCWGGTRRVHWRAIGQSCLLWGQKKKKNQDKEVIECCSCFSLWMRSLWRSRLPACTTKSCDATSAYTELNDGTM